MRILGLNSSRHGAGRKLGFGLIIGAMACNGDANGNTNEAGPSALPLDAILSNAIDPAPTSGSGMALSLSLSNGPVAYVSLVPGAVPRGAALSVRNLTTGATADAQLVDGGVDPIPVPAAVGDRLEITATDSGGEHRTDVEQVRAHARPRVVRVAAGPRQTDVPLNAIIRVVFSEPVTLESAEEGIRLRQGAAIVAGSVRVAAGNPLVMELVPDAPLAPATTYQVEVAASITDLSGDRLTEAANASFTTGTPAPGTPPPGTPPPGAPPPQLPPTGSPALVGTSPLDGDIYVMDGNGANRIRLSFDGAFDNFDAYPAWSPDGSRIAFSKHGYPTTGIYVMNADGTNVVRLSAEGGYDADPTWSPDGSRIAFESRRDSTGYDGINCCIDPEIYVMNADGTNQMRLTNHPEQPDYLPAWSPDGSRIAYVTYAPDGGGQADIYVVNVDGTNRVRLTNHDAWDTEPAWSPDGRRIVFVSSGDLYIMNADGSNVVRLTTHGGIGQPTWSPDGLMIAFTQYGCGEEAEPGCQSPPHYWKVRVSDGLLFQLAGDEFLITYPAWRP